METKKEPSAFREILLPSIISTLICLLFSWMIYGAMAESLHREVKDSETSIQHRLDSMSREIYILQQYQLRKDTIIINPKFEIKINPLK